MFHIAGGPIAELKQKQEEVDRFENGFNLTKLNIDNIQVQVTAVINWKASERLCSILDLLICDSPKKHIMLFILIHTSTRGLSRLYVQNIHPNEYRNIDHVWNIQCYTLNSFMFCQFWEIHNPYEQIYGKSILQRQQSNHSIKRWSDITSFFISNNNIICFIAILDLFSAKNGFENNTKS